MTRRRRGGVKRRETDLASNQFHKFLRSLEHSKRFTELGGEEKGEGGDISDLGRKRRVKRRRGQSNQQSNHLTYTPK